MEWCGSSPDVTRSRVTSTSKSSRQPETKGQEDERNYSGKHVTGTPPDHQMAVDCRCHSMERGRVSHAHRPILPYGPRLPDRERQSPSAGCPAHIHSLLAGNDRSHDAA